MIESDAIDAIWVLIALASIGAVWILGIRPLIDENGRLQIFQERDRLFDRAAAGELSFGDDNYRRTRALLNAQIRYMHKVDGLQLLLILVSRRWVGVDRVNAFSISNPEYRQALDRSFAIVFRTAMLKSPLLTTALLIAAWVRFVIRGGFGSGPFDQARSRVKRGLGIASAADTHLELGSRGAHSAG